MTIQVNIGEAKTRLSELLARVDEGEAVVIARDGEPKYEVTLLEVDRAAAREALERLRAIRARSKGVSREEIIAWRDEGRR